MPIKRKRATRQQRNSDAAKRPNNATVTSEDAAYSDASSSSSSTLATSSSSQWGQLPAELLSLVVRCAPFRALLRLATVSRRLQQLVVQPSISTSVSNHVSLWRHYPSVTVEVDERARKAMTNYRVMWISGERFACTNRGIEYVSSILFVLRHITELRLARKKGDRGDMMTALYATLPEFVHLHSLEVRDSEQPPSDSLTAALNTLTSLTNLELHCYDKRTTEDLTRTLHRLCSSQLEHLSLFRCQLRRLVEQQPSTPMSRLRSLAVTEQWFSSFWDYNRRHAAQDAELDVGVSWAFQLPSLLHLTVSDNGFLRQVAAAPLPQLSSLTVFGVTDADLSRIATRTFCLRPSNNDWDVRRATMLTLRDVLRNTLMRAHGIQQVAFSASRGWPAESTLASSIFPPPSDSPAGLSHLVYFEFLDGFTLVDWMSLFTAAAPPVFAAQLTHLALRLFWRDRAAAAALLPSLPSMYPSLTHVHISIEGKENKGRLPDCVEWDAALRTVRAEMGSAWCDSAADVIACREDVAWRRSVGLPPQIPLDTSWCLK